MFNDIIFFIEPIFPCPNFCGRSYKSKSARWQHLKYECGVELKYDCAICHKKFSRKPYLKKHLVIVHKIIVR